MWLKLVVKLELKLNDLRGKSLIIRLSEKHIGSLVISLCAKVEKDTVRICSILQIILYPQVHVSVKKHILRLFLDHIASLLTQTSHRRKNAQSGLY